MYFILLRAFKDYELKMAFYRENYIMSRSVYSGKGHRA